MTNHPIQASRTTGINWDPRGQTHVYSHSSFMCLEILILSAFREGEWGLRQPEAPGQLSSLNLFTTMCHQILSFSMCDMAKYKYIYGILD